MDATQAVCPHCLKKLPAPERRLGRHLRCPWCERRFELTAERISDSFDASESLGWHYLATSGERIGPVSLEELAAAKEAGEVTGETQLWREGWGRWKFADALFSSLPRHTSTEQPSGDLPVPPKSAPEAPTRHWQRWSKVLRELGTTIEWVSQILLVVGTTEGLAALVLAVLGVLTRNMAPLLMFPGLALHALLLITIRRQLKSVLPPLRAWTETGEARAGEMALREVGRTLNVTVWLVAATLFAVAWIGVVIYVAWPYLDWSYGVKPVQ